MSKLLKKQEERRSILVNELMPQTLEEVTARFDTELEKQKNMKWTVSKEVKAVLSTDCVDIINSTEYNMQMSGVVKMYNEKLKDSKLKELTFQDVKILQRFLNDAKFTGYEQACKIQNVLNVTEAFNMDIAESEIDVYFVNEVMSAKEKEQTENVWHELTLNWALENKIELPEVPKK